MSTFIGAEAHRILRLRYCDGLTQEEIAPLVGFSQEKVSRIIRAAKAKARSRPDLIRDPETII